MSFFNKMIGAMGEVSDLGDEKNIDIFMDAQKAGRECVEKLIAASKPYADSGNFFEASLFLFTATWVIVGHMHEGVRKSIKNHGKGSVVARLWHLLRVGFTSGSLTETMPKLDSFMDDFEAGKFDDI